MTRRPATLPTAVRLATGQCTCVCVHMSATSAVVKVTALLTKLLILLAKIVVPVADTLSATISVGWLRSLQQPLAIMATPTSLSCCKLECPDRCHGRIVDRRNLCLVRCCPPCPWPTLSPDQVPTPTAGAANGLDPAQPAMPTIGRIHGQRPLPPAAPTLTAAHDHGLLCPRPQLCPATQAHGRGHPHAAPVLSLSLWLHLCCHTPSLSRPPSVPGLIL